MAFARGLDRSKVWVGKRGDGLLSKAECAIKVAANYDMELPAVSDDTISVQCL